MPFINKEAKFEPSFENQIWNINNFLLMMITSLPVVAKIHHGKHCVKGWD
jgi:hypothetical protein